MSEDVKKFLLATSNFGEEIQRELDLYVTNNRLDKASFRRGLNPISKNIIRNKNSIKLLLKDVKHFDAQNLVIGSLIKEVDVGKKKDSSKFLGKAPDIRDLEIQSRLNKLSEANEFFNRRDNNNFFLPNPTSPSLGPLPPPLSSDLFNIPNVPRIDEFLNNSDFNFDFPTVMLHQRLICHCLGDLQETFFQTDHQQLKLHQMWEQIRHKQ